MTKVYFSSKEIYLIIFSSLHFIMYIEHILKQPGFKKKKKEGGKKKKKSLKKIISFEYAIKTDIRIKV